MRRSMLRIFVVGLALLQPLLVLAQAQAQSTASVSETPAALLPFASEEGLSRLARAGAKGSFPLLANQFEAQSNAAFCGPTTATIVLNAIQARSSTLPRDAGRLSTQDLRYVSGSADLTVARHTQDSVIAKGAKTRAQVLGEPVTVSGKTVQDFGYQLREFDDMLRAHGVATRMVIVDAARGLADIRNDLVGALSEPGRYAIVNYQRRAVGQRGGGHISPLGAYDAASDSFLVMDVNPGSAGWVWMDLSTLVGGMRTFDTVENRGYIVVTAP